MRRKLQDNIRNVRRRIDEACRKANRDPDEVRMIAVTKSVGMDVIRILHEIGLREFGENRAQQLAQRAAMLAEWLARKNHDRTDASPVQWHMIGQLQRNKVKTVLPWVSMIHSVDRLRLAEEINKRAADAGVVVDVLLEVNGGNEPQKTGVAVCAAPHLGEQIASMPNLRLRGLMTMAPLTDDRTVIARVFERVKELMEEMQYEYDLGGHFDVYSAGMSNDFDLAVEFGATVVRVGSALFDGISTALPASPQTLAPARPASD